jgi:DNA (cytosine-5)-methyltransferase 1
MVYYNEIDSYAAQWLRNLIAAGHIAQAFIEAYMELSA